MNQSLLNEATLSCRIIAMADRYGWSVEAEVPIEGFRCDLILRQSNFTHLVEVKKRLKNARAEIAAADQVFTYFSLGRRTGLLPANTSCFVVAGELSDDSQMWYSPSSVEADKKVVVLHVDEFIATLTGLQRSTASPLPVLTTGEVRVAHRARLRHTSPVGGRTLW